MIRTEFGVGDPATWYEASDNARTHSASQIKKLRRIIDEFGATQPVLLDENRLLIAGHGRKAACLLKPALVQFPEITIHGLTEPQKKALRLADNRIAEDAGWDNDKLSEVLKGLTDDGYDLDLTGFDGSELSRLLGPKSGDTDPDEVPDTPVKPVSELGDIWELGGHRLACGDATDPATVEALLGGVEPSLMVTDPPYGVEYRPANRGTGQEGWERAQGIVLNDDRSDWREAWALFPGPVAYVWHAMKTADTVLESLRAVEFTLSSQIVWRKTSPVMSPANRTASGGYNAQHECAYYVVRKGSKAGWKGDRSQSTVWDIDHLKNETGHGTQKPVECMSRPIMNNSSPGQAVYDPFCGSGTTLIACEQTERVGYGIELNPAYCDVAITRLAKFSGKIAILMETGETFTEVMARRHPDTPTAERAVRKPKGGKT